MISKILILAFALVSLTQAATRFRHDCRCSDFTFENSRGELVGDCNLVFTPLRRWARLCYVHQPEVCRWVCMIVLSAKGRLWNTYQSQQGRRSTFRSGEANLWQPGPGQGGGYFFFFFIFIRFLHDLEGQFFSVKKSGEACLLVCAAPDLEEWYKILYQSSSRQPAFEKWWCPRGGGGIFYDHFFFAFLADLQNFAL